MDASADPCCLKGPSHRSALGAHLGFADPFPAGGYDVKRGGTFYADTTKPTLPTQARAGGHGERRCRQRSSAAAQAEGRAAKHDGGSPAEGGYRAKRGGDASPLIRSVSPMKPPPTHSTHPTYFQAHHTCW